jgi:hypothetical protein
MSAVIRVTAAWRRSLQRGKPVVHERERPDSLE